MRGMVVGEGGRSSGVLLYRDLSTETIGARCCMGGWSSFMKRPRNKENKMGVNKSLLGRPHL